MAGTVTKKSSFINEVFSDIDSVFAVKGGFPRLLRSYIWDLEISCAS